MRSLSKTNLVAATSSFDRMHGCFFLLCLWTIWAAELTAGPPTVSNVRASQRAGTGLVDIYYAAADPDGEVG